MERGIKVHLYEQFSQPDQLNTFAITSDPQSLNPYSYTRNNPVNRVDPSGNIDSEFGPGNKAGAIEYLIQSWPVSYDNFNKVTSNFDISWLDQKLDTLNPHLVKTYTNGDFMQKYINQTLSVMSRADEIPFGLSNVVLKDSNENELENLNNLGVSEGQGSVMMKTTFNNNGAEIAVFRTSFNFLENNYDFLSALFHEMHHVKQAYQGVNPDILPVHHDEFRVRVAVSSGDLNRIYLELDAMHKEMLHPVYWSKISAPYKNYSLIHHNHLIGELQQKIQTSLIKRFINTFSKK
jgi:hypothetical protein